MVLRHECRIAVIKKIKRRGPSVSPCLTPIVLRKERDNSAILKLTLQLECSCLSKFMSFGGTPDFASTCQRSSRGTRSKALTRSRKSTQVSWLCSALFLMAILTAKMASMHDRPGRKPLCVSLSRHSAIGVSLAWMIFATIL